MAPLRTLQHRFHAGFPVKNEVVMKKYLSIALLTGALLMSGCGDSENFVFTNNTNVAVAPVCVDDAYTTNQDTTLTVNAANGVLANDQPNGSNLTFDTMSTQNGTVAMNQDGSFTYTPPNNFTGPDTFTYTLTNPGGMTTCTVTITVIAVNGFFVDAVNGNDGTGSFNGGNPYATIQAAVADAPTNADIVVRPGSYAGTVNLKDGQRLLGSGSTLVSPQGATRPQLTGPVVLADGNTLDFLRLDGTNGDAIDGDDQDGGIVTHCEIANLTNLGSGIQALSATGTWTITDNDIDNVAGIGVQLTTTLNDDLTAFVSDNEITNCDFNAIGFTSENTSQCTAQVHDNVMAGNQSGATFEVLATETAVFCLDLENNQNDDVYRFGIVTGAVVNVEELILSPTPSVPGNTGTVDIVTGGGFTDPTPQMDGFCGF